MIHANLFTIETVHGLKETFALAPNGKVISPYSKPVHTPHVSSNGGKDSSKPSVPSKKGEKDDISR
ncbi:hypothetical protein Pla52n_16390 [Stieleria varia]|uniref:Uncharacterized protein n=1 Tax=Stieleria varia TaxID=2528005 RepID=A0A5C6B177_9BACT|nr:hypothetical protein Pla52n_16390 [Stieleria varia]